MLEVVILKDVLPNDVYYLHQDSRIKSNDEIGKIPVGFDPDEAP